MLKFIDNPDGTRGMNSTPPDELTIRNTTENLSTFAFCDEFICKNCGIHLAEWIKLDVEDYEEYEFKFCPECREGYNAQIAEYKQLLKMAVEDISKMPCNNDTHIPESCYICEKHGNCSYTDSFKWCKADIALKLIGETNEP